MPLNKYESAGQDEEQICRGCPLLPTKTEATPDHLIMHVAAALDLSELHRSGAVFTYPGGLTVTEWACLSGLTRGRDRADRLKEDRDRKKKKTPVPKNRRNRRN